VGDGRPLGKIVRSVGVDARHPWEGYGADESAGRVALLMRAEEREEGPVHQVAGLADAFHAAQLAALLAYRGAR
jgi:hypothetical protein